MITGFNTDTEYDGRVYHVQTEDKGVDHPLIESLVYCGGEIIATRESSYEDLIRAGGMSEGEVKRRMEEQHRDLIREIRNGRFDPEGPKPFGYNIISNRSLDEVVAGFLTAEGSPEPIRIEVESDQIPVAGGEVSMTLRVVSATDGRPIPGAVVTVKLLSASGRPRKLFSGKTDAEGRVRLALLIPALEDTDAVLLCQVEARGSNTEIKRHVRTAPAPDDPDAASG